MIDQITLKLYVLVNMKAFIDWISGIRAFVDLISGVKGSNASLSISSCCVRLQMRMSDSDIVWIRLIRYWICIFLVLLTLLLPIAACYQHLGTGCAAYTCSWKCVEASFCHWILHCYIRYWFIPPLKMICAAKLTLNFHIRKASDLDSRFISHPHWTILMAAKSGREQNL